MTDQEKHAVMSKMTDHERQVLNQVAQQVRHNAHKTYIQYKTISLNLKIEDSKDINDAYEKIKTQFIIDKDVLEKFVISLNQILVSEIIQNLLETSQDLLNNIYQDGNSNQPTD